MATLELYNGDCLEIMKDLSGGSIDLFICDLPYGCLETQGRSEESRKKYNRGRGIGANSGCSWDIKLDLEKFWEQIKRLRRNEHTPCIMFGTTKFGYDLIKSNEKEFRYDLVWNKQRGVSFLSANKMPMRSHEMIYVFSKAGAYYNRIDIEGDFKSWKVKGGERPSIQYCGSKRTDTEGGDGKRCALSVIQNSISSKKGGHPTEKPMELYKWLIERYCPPGGTILDPTAGSFNSVFTAFELGLSGIGIEKDETFYNKAVKRLED